MLICKKCGKENDTNAWQCVVCGHNLHEEVKKVKPKNYIVLSVLLMLSCIPTAIVSFIYGLKVNSSFVTGEYDAMETYSQKAKLWVWISFILGIILTIISMFYIMKIFNSLNPLLTKQMQDLMRE